MDLISEVSEELAYYIYAEKKACLPGLGCFEAIYKSAEFDPINNILKAPTETIVFAMASIEDNGFVDYLTKQLAHQGVYEDFKQKVISLMNSDSQVSLPGLGRFMANTQGEIRFEEEVEEEFNFDFDDLTLRPIPSAEKPTEYAASNAPRAATEEPAKKNEQGGMSFLRIGMLAVVTALFLAVFFNQDAEKGAKSVLEPKSMQMSNNFNVSPNAIQSEVYIAAESPDGMGEALSEKERAEILDRQDAMTAERTVEIPQLKAEIITNTFGSRDNADRQLELIESLGYQSAELEQGSGLITTMIILSYTDGEDLESTVEKVKQDFPRAKVNQQ